MTKQDEVIRGMYERWREWCSACLQAVADMERDPKSPLTLGERVDALLATQSPSHTRKSP